MNVLVTRRAQPTKKSKNELLTTRVLNAYNTAMNTSRPITATPGNVEAVAKNIKKDPEWVDKYEQAAPLFPKIDDSEWPQGRVSWGWSLRMNSNGQFNPVVDRVLSGTYRLKGQSLGSTLADRNRRVAEEWVKSKNEERESIKEADAKIIKDDIHE